MAETSTPNAYLRTKVMTAAPEELRLMLFDGAVRFGQMGRDGLAQNNPELAYEGITRCQAILIELISALRPEHDEDLCEKLASLYTFMYSRLIDAATQRDAQIVDEVLELLAYERETWGMVMEQLAGANREASTMQDLPQHTGSVNFEG